MLYTWESVIIISLSLCQVADVDCIITYYMMSKVTDLTDGCTSIVTPLYYYI